MGKVLISKWKKPVAATCPQCWNEVKIFAVQYGTGWYLEERCYCDHIKNQLNWPFAEDSSKLNGADFVDVGIFIDAKKGEDSIPFDEVAYEIEEERFLQPRS